MTSSCLRGTHSRPRRPLNANGQATPVLAHTKSNAAFHDHRSRDESAPLGPVLAEARSKIPPEVFAIYMDSMAPLDARHYIGHAAPSHLLFQFAHDDTSVKAEDGKRYFELASEPKQIAWYENCGHTLNTQARIERVTWLCSHFGLPEPSQEILNLLEQVLSPIPLKN